MDIIFLDLDGVLNVIPQGFDLYGAIFHPEFVDNLKYIIEQTGAKIVISSSWRLSGLWYLKNMWEHRNYPGEIIDITPNLYDKDHKRIRGEEIDLWLKQNKKQNISNYVIIDDDSDMLENQLNNFVKTSGNDHKDCIDIGYGLTKECSEKVIQILKGL
jgi:hypothetical protein